MIVYTTCPTCRRELTVEHDGQTTHDGCRPPAPSYADQLFEQFRQLVEKIAAPGYTATSNDELNLTALQNKIDEFDQAPPRLGDAAVIYAQWKWPVFPLRAQQKVPAIPSAHPDGDPLRGACKGECGKPGHGLYDATTDVERIRRYWTANPNANIGIATGHAFDVIDVDLPDGPESFSKMQNVPPIHGQVSTASGGRHYLIAPIAGRGNGARIFPGVDYRGMGGYIVAAPSWLGSKARQWQWITKPSPTITRQLVA